MRACRLLIDPSPADGAWNMAVDEALLESAVAGSAAASVAASVATVRLYQWARPTLSLGYFQPADEVVSNDRWRGLPVVRRLSGGGAILHDRELTYSLAIPASHPAAQDPRVMYDRVHGVFIQALEEFGISTKLRGTKESAKGDEFLCFARGDDFDVVWGNTKVLGSAQRRRKGAVLQHGSLILRRSRFAPEIPGLMDLVQIDVPAERIIAAVAAGLGSLFADHPNEEKLTLDEQALAAKLRDMRYSKRLH